MEKGYGADFYAGAYACLFHFIQELSCYFNSFEYFLLYFVTLFQVMKIMASRVHGLFYLLQVYFPLYLEAHTLFLEVPYSGTSGYGEDSVVKITQSMELLLVITVTQVFRILKFQRIFISSLWSPLIWIQSPWALLPMSLQ